MLPRKKRLRSDDFVKMRGARTLHSPHFFARIKNSACLEEGKTAAVVSAKTAKSAAERNLLRRRVYETVRARLPALKGAWVVIAAKRGAATLPFAELKRELSALLAESVKNDKG